MTSAQPTLSCRINKIWHTILLSTCIAFGMQVYVVRRYLEATKVCVTCLVVLMQQTSSSQKVDETECEVVESDS